MMIPSNVITAKDRLEDSTVHPEYQETYESSDDTLVLSVQ
jgi:hypothetical protein